MYHYMVRPRSHITIPAIGDTQATVREGGYVLTDVEYEAVKDDPSATQLIRVAEGAYDAPKPDAVAQAEPPRKPPVATLSSPGPTSAPQAADTIKPEEAK
jgi:hypothetical protein